MWFTRVNVVARTNKHLRIKLKKENERKEGRAKNVSRTTSSNGLLVIDDMKYYYYTIYE